MIMTIFKHLWIPMAIGIDLYIWWWCISVKTYSDGEPIDKKDLKDIRNICIFGHLFLVFLASIICFSKF